MYSKKLLLHPLFQATSYYLNPNIVASWLMISLSALHYESERRKVVKNDFGRFINCHQLLVCPQKTIASGVGPLTLRHGGTLLPGSQRKQRLRLNLGETCLNQ